MTRPNVGPPAGNRWSGISFGYYRTFVTNSRPSILTQSRRCLRYFDEPVNLRGWGGPPVNFITAEADHL
jgi:hypothetical protein